jgi:hypothetical protein
MRHGCFESVAASLAHAATGLEDECALLDFQSWLLADSAAPAAAFRGGAGRAMDSIDRLYALRDSASSLAAATEGIAR